MRYSLTDKLIIHPFTALSVLRLSHQYWVKWDPSKTQILFLFLELNHYVFQFPDPFLTFGALAVERVDLVNAFAVVEARLVGALVCVDVAEHALIP